MKTLAALLLLIIGSLAHAQPSRSQGCEEALGGGETGVTLTCVFGSNMTVGRTAICDVYWDDNTVTITSVTGGGTWATSAAKVNESEGDNKSTQSFVLSSIGSATNTVTVNFSTNTAPRVVHCSEWTGLDTTTQPDASASAQTTQYPVDPATDVVVTGSVTSVTDGALLYACAYRSFSTTGVLTAGTSNTQSTVETGDEAGRSLCEYRIQGSAGSATSPFTVTGGSGMAYFSRLVAYRPAATSSREQEGFRWGVDDGNEASHTFEAAADTNISIADNQSRLIRALVNATGDPASSAYTLRYQKNGSGGYVAVPVGSTTATSISNQNVAASADDGQDIGGTNTINGTTIGASLDATTEWAGMRFTNITIPVGATITSASVGVVPSGTGEDEPLVTVYLEAADDCAAFTTGASNISGRSRTTGVSWSSTDLGATGSSYHSTPDLTTDFQAVINRGGWASGNDVCVLIQGGATGTRDLTIEAQDLGPNTNPPRLSVAWTTPNQVYVTTSANITAGGEATTARLTAPSGKSTSDFVTGRRWDDENGTDTIDITTDDYTEVEWLVFIAASAADSDFFDFRTYAGAAALDTYTLTPRWTIPSAGGGASIPKIMHNRRQRTLH